jgi:sodium/hydrogen antiporter
VGGGIAFVGGRLLTIAHRGLVFGAMVGRDNGESVELAELGGSLLSLVLWFIFGAGFVLAAFEHLDGRVVAYAICSLTVVRMGPVALALLGADEEWATVVLIGWFGPRGLASVVFALLAVEDLGGTDPRIAAAVHAIAFSIVAHGVTARPLAGRYLAAMESRRRMATPPGVR